MPEPGSELHRLAGLMGVATRFVDGLGRTVEVDDETLVHVCAAMGAPVQRPSDAGAAVATHRAAEDAELVSPVAVAWDGVLGAVEVRAGSGERVAAELTLEDGSPVPMAIRDRLVVVDAPLPPGYHQLRVDTGTRQGTCTVISAPERAWRPPGDRRSWGVSAHLAALRSGRSRSVGDLHDLATLCEWVGGHGGELVTVLPLLPTFNDPPAEPSPYSPVSRLFWSELVLDLGADTHPVAAGPVLDVGRAVAEVRRALEGRPPAAGVEPDEELARYARFRGAQARLGRNWRAWPVTARDGRLGDEHVDAVEERCHLVAQIEARHQLADLQHRARAHGVELGLDLAVGVHPDGYDTWSRPGLFATEMAVGAPPDAGFPSGQSWGFPPVLPAASRAEGHRYLAASVAHQASIAGVLRVDHVMAMSRLYWIPDGMTLAEGTYVDYPRDELFAVLCLESHRAGCEVVGENLGTVPPEIDQALARHGIRGMYLAEFEAARGGPIAPPTGDEVAMIDTHDTPTLAGWMAGVDIAERARLDLLAAADVGHERHARRQAVSALATQLGADPDDPGELLALLLDWLAGSVSPLVSIWLEDLWLEVDPVNIPGSSSAERPNWQRPISRPLEEVLADADVAARVGRLARSVELGRSGELDGSGE